MCNFVVQDDKVIKQEGSGSKSKGNERVLNNSNGEPLNGKEVEERKGKGEVEVTRIEQA